MSEKIILANRIQNLAVAAKEKVASFLSGNRRSLFLGHGTHFEDLRDYMDGDDLRHIDWKQSAKRQNKLIVKEFQVERNANVVFLLDISASMMLGKDNERMKSAIIGVASLAHATIQNKDFFGFAAHSDQEQYFIPPKGGRQHEFLIYRKLLDIIPKGKTALGKAIKQVATSLKKRSIIIVLTDLHDDLDDLLKGFKIAKAFNHDLQVIQITDYTEFSLPDKIGKIKFKHPETNQQTVADFTDPIVSGRYAYEVNKEVAKIIDFKRKLRGLNIKLVTSHTEDMTEKFLLTYFSRKQRGFA